MQEAKNQDILRGLVRARDLIDGRLGGGAGRGVPASKA